MSNLAKVRISRVLILGNKGFIGQHLEKRFCNGSPEVEVVGKDLPGIDLTSENDVKKMANLFTLDTAVIMLSAIKRQFGDTLEVFNKNLRMTTNLCRLLQERPVARFVFFSSASVYGEDIHNISITEETPVHPTSYYGIMKFTSERLYWKALSSHKQNSLLILRPPTIYGPGDEGLTYGPVKFTNAAVKEEEITLWGDGTELREFIFIADVVNIVHQLTFSSVDGVINLASGISYSFREVLEVVETISRRKLCVNSRPRTKAKVDNAFSNDRLLKEIGDYPFTPLTEGIKVLYKHLSSSS
jgi:UDP-glucose 4-epimerase